MQECLLSFQHLIDGSNSGSEPISCTREKLDQSIIDSPYQCRLRRTDWTHEGYEVYNWNTCPSHAHRMPILLYFWCRPSKENNLRIQCTHKLVACLGEGSWRQQRSQNLRKENGRDLVEQSFNIFQHAPTHEIIWSPISICDQWIRGLIPNNGCLLWKRRG